MQNICKFIMPHELYSVENCILNGMLCIQKCGGNCSSTVCAGSLDDSTQGESVTSSVSGLCGQCTKHLLISLPHPSAAMLCSI